ncbi:phosphotransferase [Streptomyces sp. NPDC058964]|uniref:phosphotransferase n=1 Tax=Streptomyces sp. NPDC058964 TaxID=3346681 RepID=UPI003691A060
MTADVLQQLTAEAAAVAHRGGADCACDVAMTLADRPDAVVVRHAGAVAKAHDPHTDPAELALRLALATRHPDILLAPLAPAPVALHDRLVTLWPYGTPVSADDPDAAPWEAAAGLLARLHRIPAADPAPTDRTPGAPCALPDGAFAFPAPRGPMAATLFPAAATPPPMRGPAKAARAVARLRAALAAAPAPHPAAPPILRAWAALPAWARAEAPMTGATTVCHGDLHLGQLVRHPSPDGPWRLIDVDDLGVGAPAWDLARPAAWYACGLLPPDEWTRFLSAYRATGGPAVPADGDPWPALDVPARALTVQTAALFLAKALAAGRELDEVERCLVDACDRMDSVPAEFSHAIPK